MSDTKPKIRFKGFTDPWEQRKLGDCFVERQERSAEGELISVTINDGVRLFEDLDRHDNSSEDKSHYKRVEVGDIAYNSMRMWQGASGYSPYNGILSPAYTVITPKKGINAQFFAYVFKLPQMVHAFKIHSQGLTSDTWTLKYPAFSAIGVRFPNIEEQIKVASLFQNLDNLITLHQRKCEMLQKTKKALLEKMFPQNGSAFPEVRFKGFTEAWEQRKLSEAVDVRSGQDYKHLSEGDIPVYGTGGYMLSVDKALSYSEDAIGIGRKGTIDKPFLLHAPFWTVDTLFYAIPRCGYNLEFNYSVFQRIDWKRKDESTGVPSLSKTTINDIEIFVPEFSEQKRIGTFFKEIDNLITLHQRAYEALKQMKQALLQKMFV